MGLQFLEDGCNLISFRDRDRFRDEKRHACEIQPHIDLGDALFDWEEPQDPIRDFVGMADKVFHARVGELLGDSGCALYHSVAFYRMRLRERCRHVFGCEGRAQIRAREMLRLALTLELGVGGSLSNWSSVSWHPWAKGPLIVGRGEDRGRAHCDVPASLERWLVVIGEATGCKVREEIVLDDEGLHGFARHWAGAYVVSAQKPSGHELIETSLRLREMLEAR